MLLKASTHPPTRNGIQKARRRKEKPYPPTSSACTKHCLFLALHGPPSSSKHQLRALSLREAFHSPSIWAFSLCAHFSSLWDRTCLSVSVSLASPPLAGEFFQGKSHVLARCLAHTRGFVFYFSQSDRSSFTASSPQSCAWDPSPQAGW